MVVATTGSYRLRHSFAVGTLLRWYRSGIDPQARILQLSSFSVTPNPTSTAVYLTITTELLSEASQRFKRWADPLTLDSVLRFLHHLEVTRHNHRRTRNHGRTVVRAFSSFSRAVCPDAWRSPDSEHR